MTDDLKRFKDAMMDFTFEMKNGEIHCWIEKPKRITSMQEEEQWARRLRGLGAQDVEIIVRVPGITKFRFKVSYLTKVA